MILNTGECTEEKAEFAKEGTFFANIFPSLRTFVKVHIFWESHKILQNIHLAFDWHYTGQKQGGDFAKFCGLLRIYEL